MKFALIGPFPPFRSGVARHTGALADELACYGEVARFSFSRQYPSWLFPGENDRDESAIPASADFCIDSINPLSWRKAVRRIKEFRPDAAIIPAWTFFTAPALTFIASSLRRAGIPVVAMVHNAADHETAKWKSWLLARQIRQADSAITHNQALARAIARIAGKLPVTVAPHPLFDYPQAKGNLPRRASLELLMFGLVRPYKGVDLLLEAFATCADCDVKLSIVGEVWGDAKALRNKIDAQGLGDRIELVPHYVSDSDAAEYFKRADIVVLPYTHVTGSGVAPVAFHYGKPVIASGLEGFRELIRSGETGWLFPAGDAKALATLIKERAQKNDAGSLAPHIAAQRARLSWPAFVKAVIETIGAIDKTTTLSDALAPKVSIVMPVHNGALYLEEALNSILAQTLSDFEFLIVDDGSTDATPDLLKEYACRDSRIRVLRNDMNTGIAAALNLGFGEARGRYVARMDCDDISAPERLERQARFLDNNPDFVFVACAYDMIDGDGSCLRTGAEAHSAFECDWVSIFRMPVIHPSMMIRRDAFERLEEGYKSSIEGAKDLELTQRLLRLGLGKALEDVLFKYRMHPQNISVKHKPAQSRAAASITAANAKMRFSHLDADDLNALFSFFYGVTEKPDLDAAFAALAALEEAYVNETSPNPAQRARMRMLIARWVTKAALANKIIAKPASFARLLWLARAYLPHAPKESVAFVARRITT